jgi:hypothetical protein
MVKPSSSVVCLKSLAWINIPNSHGDMYTMNILGCKLEDGQNPTSYRVHIFSFCAPFSQYGGRSIHVLVEFHMTRGKTNPLTWHTTFG